MRFLSVALVLSLLPSLSWAQSEMSASLHHIDYGDRLGEDTLVYLSNGRVVRMNSFSQLEELQAGVQSKKFYEISVDENKEILSFKEAVDQPVTMRPTQKNLETLLFDNYNPSMISMEKAREFFYESMPSPKESQCYNRAHIWSHEWRIKHNLYSKKVWVFFTRKYIREFAFDWWFHVSPYVHVIENGKVRERVMDVKYTRGPLKLKQWTDIFLHNDAPCPVVERYTDHANYPEFGSCFLMKSSMYYYQPADLEWKEAFGIEKNVYVPSEIVAAYLEAFDIDIQGN
jgi:hypothetical protein